jgi:alpha-2-macroglobulin
VTNDSRYLLAGSYALSGRWNSYYELMPGFFKEEKTDRLSGGSFDSDIRANALMLNVLLEIEPSSKQIPFIIRYLSGRMKEMYSTQETCFALLALGKAAKLTSNSNVKVDLLVNNKSIGNFNGKDINLPIDKNAANLSIRSSGQGEIYYFQNTLGVKTGEVKDINSHMGVSRTYYDCRTKKEVSGNHFYQGEMIACKITLVGYNIQADNIAITDLIPSGFEIENPRLENNDRKDWNSTMEIKYMDIRDDRLILFTNVVNSNRVFYYFMRVVNRGKFQLPVISAESMYQPDIKSVSGRGVVSVNEFVR